ncbi:MAG: FixH family protein [Pseudomonadota bacterium]
MSREFRLTGRHVLMALLGFFLLVAAANAIFITYAVRSFPGEREEKSYLQGMNFNERLAERAEQQALGWRVEVTKAGLSDGEATIRLRILGEEDAPLGRLEVTGVMMRPASDEGDRPIVFVMLGGGAYEGVVEAEPGLWLLEAQAASASGEIFEFSSRLTL